MGNLDWSLQRHQGAKLSLLHQYPELAEDDDALRDTLEGITDLVEQIRATARAMREDEATVEALDRMIAEMQERRDRYRHRIEVKRTAIQRAMQEGGHKKFDWPEVTLSLRAVAPKVVITDEGALTAEFVRTKTEPDKTAIRDALNAGIVVPGAQLSNGGEALQVRKS